MKVGTPLNQTTTDSGFDKFMNRPFEGLGAEFEQTGYSYQDLVANMEELKAKQFTTTIAFTSTDYRTVTWAEGTIEYQDGTTTPAITTSNTGNMAARTYIYYDPQASKVALQTTTTASVATQGERLLLAIAVPNAVTTKKAEVQTFGATGMYVGNLSVEHLTAGTIRSKTVTLAVEAGTGDCYFNSGKTDFTNTDSGFILGIDDSDSDKAKFYIGDSTKYLNWDGSALVLQGVVKNGSGTTLIDATGLVSTVNFTSDSVVNTTGRTYSNSAAYEDIANTSITTASLARTTNVLVIYTLNVVEFPINGTTAFAGKVTLRIDSTDQTGNNFELELTSLSPIANTSAWGGPLTASGIISLSSGTHTLKLRAQTINTNSQLNVETTSVVYIVLGT